MGLRDVALRIRGGRSLLHTTVTAFGLTVFLFAPQATRAVAQSMSLPGKFDVSSSGAATYSIPIAVPPGTAGMTPGLAFSFSSQGSNGIVGMGWSLSGVPSITRCPQTFAQDGVRGGVNFDSNDRFCLDGQRLMAINNGVYGADGTEYRTEIESFTRVISHGAAGNGPAWFEVHTKSGQIMEFGNTSDSQILAQGKPTARSWAVNKVSDTKGNYYTVTYANNPTNDPREIGQAYPARIDYTGNAGASLQPYNSVRFVYALRPDITPAYQAGSLVQTTARLTNVQTFAGSNLVMNYQLAYDAAVTSVSSLTSITACAADGSCLPATTFSATSNSGALNAGSFNPGSISSTCWNFGSPPHAGWTPIVGDFNGDGKTDFLFVTGDYYNDINYFVVFLSNGDGFSATCSQNNVPLAALSAPPTLNWTSIVGDFNGDGKTEFAFVGLGVVGSLVEVFLSNGDGTFSSSIFTAPWNFGAPSPAANWTPIVGDFNGDNKTDFAFAGGNNVDVFLSNGDGSFATNQFTDQNGSWQCGTPPNQGCTPIVGDFNGDGQTDFGLAGGNGLRVFLSNGNGTFSVSTPGLDGANFGNPPDAGWTPIVGDFNGDGKTDFAFAGGKDNGNSTVQVFLSKGDGTFVWSGLTIGGYLGSPPAAGWTPIVGDFNGDGKTDFAFVTGNWVATWVSKGDGTFLQGGFNSPWNFGAPPDNGWTPIVGDFNGDGKADFAFVGATSIATFVASGPQFYQLNHFTTGLGATTAISYQPLTNNAVYVKDTTSIYPVLDVQMPIYVVSRVDTSNGIGGTYSTTYGYFGAKADPVARGFFGFRQMQALDLQTNILSTTNFRQDYPYIGLTASQTKTLNGTTLSATYNAYGFNALGGTRYQVFLTESQTSGADLDGSVLPTTTTSYRYDAYGNATQIIVSTTDGHSKTTTNTYTNDTTNWLLGRLTNATVTSQLSQPGSPPPVASTPVVVAILQNTRSFNLWNYLTANNMVTGTPGTAFSANVTIATRVVVGSNSPNIPAFDTGALPSGSTVQVTNNGYIAGAGGTGGTGGYCGSGWNIPAAQGGAGGPGLRAQVSLTLVNNGSIWGGGGGGGGGQDGYDSYYGPFGGGNGGGGAAFGSGGTVSSGGGWPGSPGTLTAGGAGGAGIQSGPEYAGTGGTGGGPALAGGIGGASNMSSCYGPGAGGPPGPAVVGNSFITWTATGDVRGALN